MSLLLSLPAADTRHARRGIWRYAWTDGSLSPQSV